MAQHVAVPCHGDGGLAQVVDLQAQGEGAEQGFVGLGHARVEPGVPRVVEHALARDLRRDLEARVEPRLERALLEERLREGVDGRDGRALEVGGGGLEPLSLLFVLGLVERFLDAFS